jgi:diguanylate cyclase (GGDEF)-like protein/PAS domain S-box-containing protein
LSVDQAVMRVGEVELAHSRGLQFAVSLIEFAVDAALDPSGESQRRLRALAQHLPIAVWAVDAGGNFTMAYGSAQRRLAIDDDALVGGSVGLIGPEVADRFSRAIEGTHEDFHVEGTTADRRWVFTGAVVPLPEGKGAVAVSVDITESILADAQLRESEARTRAILEAATEGIVTVDDQGLIVDFNAAAEGIFDCDSDDVVGTPVDALIAEEHREVLMGYFRDRVIDGGATVAGPAREVLALRSDGVTVPVELRINEVMTRSGRLFTGVLHDISERRAFEQELEHQATHDHLTGLPNRALLVAQLDAALARAHRHVSSVAVLFLELDRIKIVTDTLGHRVGDEIIVEVARRLEKVARPSGTVTRFGGDQFVVFCEELDDVGDAVDVADRILASVHEPFQIGDEEAFISASVGIAFSPHGLSTADVLISNADVAMHRAKERDQRYEIFDVEMRAWVESRRRIELALRYGIERNEFDLHYQPIVDLTDGRVLGVEALARWNHPAHGLLAPSEFIPVAEDSGLIVQLGDSLLRRACEQLTSWERTHPDLFVSFNLSGRQLAMPDLVASIRGALSSSGAKPGGLHLELTETILLHDVEGALQALHDLNELGVRVCLDDFGTGYSSLSYLTRFPIDTLKVDRSFVSQLGVNDRESSVVTMIVGMATTLGIEVIAEGVETARQHELLKGFDCPMGQGFLFSPPMPASDIAALLGRDLLHCPG